jgi:hypothetical protein
LGHCYLFRTISSPSTADALGPLREETSDMWQEYGRMDREPSMEGVLKEAGHALRTGHNLCSSKWFIVALCPRPRDLPYSASLSATRVSLPRPTFWNCSKRSDQLPERVPDWAKVRREFNQSSLVPALTHISRRVQVCRYNEVSK